MPLTALVLLLPGLFMLVIIARAMTIIRENQRGGVVRLGMYVKTLRPGWHIAVPFIDLVTKVDLDASLPGWRSLSDPELEEAVKSFVTTGVVVPARGVANRAVAPSSSTRAMSAEESLTAFLLMAASEQTGVDLSNDAMARTRLAERAKNAVTELRSSDSCEINLPFLTADARGPKNFATRLTKSKLEEIVGSSLN